MGCFECEKRKWHGPDMYVYILYSICIVYICFSSLQESPGRHQAISMVKGNSRCPNSQLAKRMWDGNMATTAVSLLGILSLPDASLVGTKHV